MSSSTSSNVNQGSLSSAHVAPKPSAFQAALKDELPYQAAQYPTYEDVPGCMRLFDEFLMCYALAPQIRNIYRYSSLRDCSPKLEDFKFCMSSKSEEEEQRRVEWIRRRAEWWAGRRVGGSSEDVWRVRSVPLQNFPPTWPTSAAPEGTIGG